MIALLTLVASSTISYSAPPSQEAFPTRPDPTLTPGSLCDNTKTRRYPEGIAYCNRSVGKELKRDVMEEYDARLGFRVTQMERDAFKIDHYIPLCMGGSNRQDNLWPQHKTVYEITDPLEAEACQKMAKGVLKQADALELIRRAKANLDQVPEIRRQIGSL